MDRDDIFNEIVRKTADVMKLDEEQIRNKALKTRRIVRARTIILFWCDSAYLEDEDVAECTGYTIGGIKKLRETIESRWKEEAAFRLMTMEVGKRCDLFLQDQGIVVDMIRVYNKWQHITGRSEIKPADWKKYNEP